MPANKYTFPPDLQQGWPAVQTALDKLVEHGKPVTVIDGHSKITGILVRNDDPGMSSIYWGHQWDLNTDTAQVNFPLADVRRVFRQCIQLW